MSKDLLSIFFISIISISSGASHAAQSWTENPGHGSYRFLFTLEGLANTVSDDVRELAFSPDGSMVAGVSTFSQFHIWNSKTGAVITKIGSAPNSSRFGSISWSSDGSKLIAGNGVFDVSTWTRLYTLDRQVAQFSPDGSKIALWDVYGVKIVSSKDLSVVQEFPGFMRTLAWSPDSSKVLIATAGKTIVIRDVTSGRTLLRFRDDGYLENFAWSPDGTMIAGGDHTDVWLWSAIDGRFLRLLKSNDYNGIPKVTWSRDSKKVYATHMSSMVLIWNADSGELGDTIEMPGSVYGMDLTNNDELLVVGGNFGNVAIFIRDGE